MVFKIFQKLLTTHLIQLLTFYLLLWNYLLILKMITKTLHRIPFSLVGWCSLVPTSHWRKNNFTQALPVWFYRITGGFSVKIPALGLWSRLLEGFSKLVRNFKEASKNFMFDYFINLATKILKYFSACTECTLPIYYYKPLKKIFILWHNTFWEILSRDFPTSRFLISLFNVSAYDNCVVFVILNMLNKI